MKFSLKQLVLFVTITAMFFGVAGYSYKRGKEAGRLDEVRKFETLKAEELQSLEAALFGARIQQAANKQAAGTN